MADQAPRRHSQLATPNTTRRNSEELAREAESYEGSSGMNIEPETPTPMPPYQPPPYEQPAQPAQPTMADMMREMQGYMQRQQAQAAAQEARFQAQAAAQEARIQELQNALQNTAINANSQQRPQSQADPNAAFMAQFMSFLQSNTVQDPLEKEENRITRLSNQH